MQHPGHRVDHQALEHVTDWKKDGQQGEGGVASDSQIRRVSWDFGGYPAAGEAEDEAQTILTVSCWARITRDLLTTDHRGSVAQLGRSETASHVDEPFVRIERFDIV